MDNFNSLTALLALIVLCTIPIYCELTLDEGNLNHDIGGSQFQDNESIRNKRSHDQEQTKIRKGKHHLQKEENVIPEKQLKTVKHKKNIFRMSSRDKAIDKSDVEKTQGLYSRGQEDNISENEVDPDAGKYYAEDEDSCIDDSEPVKVLTTTKRPIKREIKPWNYNDLKSGSRKRNYLDENNSSNETQEAQKSDDDEEACIDEAPVTEKPTTQTPKPDRKPVKREISPYISDYLKSFPHATLQNETRLPKYCVHNETSQNEKSNVVEEIMTEVPEEKQVDITEEECTDKEDSVAQADDKKMKEKKRKRRNNKAKREAKKQARRKANKSKKTYKS